VAHTTSATRPPPNTRTGRSPAQTRRPSAQHPDNGGQPGMPSRDRWCSDRSSRLLSALSHPRRRAMQDGRSSTNEAAGVAVGTSVRRHRRRSRTRHPSRWGGHRNASPRLAGLPGHLSSLAIAPRWRRSVWSRVHRSWSPRSHDRLVQRCATTWASWTHFLPSKWGTVQVRDAEVAVGPSSGQSRS
jgi:hypothetical protein